MIKVLLVDDHNLVRLALKNILTPTIDIKVVGEAESGESAISLVRELKPDIVMMDVQMPGIGGLETTHRLLQANPKLKIIVLTAHEEDPFPYSFVHAGAAGYLTKNTGADELLLAIRNVYAGHPYITASIAQQLALKQISYAAESPFATLSKRELQVMWMIANGNKVKDIAQKLCLSVKTISTYRLRLFQKLQIKNDVELTRLAMRYGMIDDTHLPKL